MLLTKYCISCLQIKNRQGEKSTYPQQWLILHAAVRRKIENHVP